MGPVRSSVRQDHVDALPAPGSICALAQGAPPDCPRQCGVPDFRVRRHGRFRGFGLGMALRGPSDRTSLASEKRLPSAKHV